MTLNKIPAELPDSFPDFPTPSQAARRSPSRRETILSLVEMLLQDSDGQRINIPNNPVSRTTETSLAWMSTIRLREQKHFISLKGASITLIKTQAHISILLFLLQIYLNNSFETLPMLLVDWEAPLRLFLLLTDFENVWLKFFTSIRRMLLTFFRKKLRTFLANQLRNFVHQNDAQGVVGEEGEKHPYTF